MGEVEVKSQKSHSTSTLASPQALKPPLQAKIHFQKRKIDLKPPLQTKIHLQQPKTPLKPPLQTKKSFQQPKPVHPPRLHLSTTKPSYSQHPNITSKQKTGKIIYYHDDLDRLFDNFYSHSIWLSGYNVVRSGKDDKI